MWVSLYKGRNSAVEHGLTWKLLFCVFIPLLLWHFAANHDGQIFSSCFHFYMSPRPTAGTIFSHFSAFLAFCWGGREIPGGGGVCSRVLRCRGGGLGNCPEIAHCHCPPSYQLPLLRFTFQLKAKFWPQIYQKILRGQLSCMMAGRHPIMSEIKHEMPLFHASGPVWWWRLIIPCKWCSHHHHHHH